MPYACFSTTRGGGGRVVFSLGPCPDPPKTQGVGQRINVVERSLVS